MVYLRVLATKAVERVYNSSIVAYLDILGFRNRVEKTTNDPGKIQEVYELLSNPKSHILTLNSLHQTSELESIKKLQVCMFSDTIVLSYPEVSADLLHFMVQHVALFQMGIIENGSFLRGAIVIGDHYQEGDLLFGPAIIKAFDMEKLASWPRVLIDPNALNELTPEDMDAMLWSYFSYDDSGLLYLDYLRETWLDCTIRLMDGQTKVSYNPPEQLFPRHREAILKEINVDTGAPKLDILTKYHASAAYHNKAIDYVCDKFTDVYALQKSNPDTYKDMLQSYKIDLPTTFRQLYMQGQHPT